MPIQNEQFTTKIPLALQSNDPPTSTSSGAAARWPTQVKAGKVMDITSASQPWIKQRRRPAAGWQVNGKQYGVPYSLGIVGFWYSKDLFEQGRHHRAADDHGRAASPTSPS